MALLVSNCSGDSGTIAENEALKAECDSLRNEFSKLQSRANKREAFLDSLCLYLDSISEQEHILVQTSDPETNRRYTRAEMRKRIQELGEIIARQREHIQALAEHYSMLSATEDPGRIQSLMNITLTPSKPNRHQGTRNFRPKRRARKQRPSHRPAQQRGFTP